MLTKNIILSKQCFNNRVLQGFTHLSLSSEDRHRVIGARDESVTELLQETKYHLQK